MNSETRFLMLKKTIPFNTLEMTDYASWTPKHFWFSDAFQRICNPL